MGFENLVAELVRLSECEADGQPNFTIPPAAAARIMSRDTITDLVEQKQGLAQAARLRRMLRAEDYGGGLELVLEGYASALRAAGAASSPFLRVVEEQLVELARGDSQRHPPCC